MVISIICLQFTKKYVQLWIVLNSILNSKQIISVTLENYTDFEMNQEIKKYNKQHSQGHEHAPSFSDFSKTSDLVNSKDAPLV